MTLGVAIFTFIYFFSDFNIFLYFAWVETRTLVKSHEVYSMKLQYYKIEIISLDVKEWVVKGNAGSL